MRKDVRSTLALLLVGAVAGMELARMVAPSDPVRAAVAGAGHEVIAFTADGPSSEQVLYIIDPKLKTFSLYSVDLRKTKVKLAAVRHYQADHQLAEYNNDAPLVSEIEKLVQGR